MRRVAPIAAGIAVVLLATWFGWPRAGDGPAGGVGDNPEPRPYLRLAVTRDAATRALAIARADLIETAVSPLSGPGGFYAVLDGPDGPLAVRPFSLGHDRVEEFWGEGVTTQRPGTVPTASMMVYLPWVAGATGLRVLDDRGATVATLDGATLAGFADARGGPALVDRLGATFGPTVHAASTVSALGAAYPHILFIETLPDLVAHQGDVAAVSPIDPAFATALDEALAGMSPVLRGSIGSIAMVEFPGSGLGQVTTCAGSTVATMKRGQTLGNNIVINAKALVAGSVVTVSPGQIRDTLVHESVHAFNNLVDDPDIDVEQLPADVQVLVDDARDNLGHMYGAIRKTWTQLNASGRIAYPGYGSYVGLQAFCAYPGVPSAVQAGFAAPYGAFSAKEDFATYVQLFQRGGPPAQAHPVCQQFSGLTNQIPRDRLLPFAKLNFVRGLGVIDEADYLACVQQADPADHDGFEIAGRSFGQGFKVGAIGQPTDAVSTVPGSRFVVLGSSSASRGMVQIYARPPHYSPIGFHRLDKTAGWLTPYVGMTG
ncbi:MAG: hypothetical protein AB7N90_16210, partial [Vicinamibacterales bacterium]